LVGKLTKQSTKTHCPVQKGIRTLVILTKVESHIHGQLKVILMNITK